MANSQGTTERVQSTEILPEDPVVKYLRRRQAALEQARLDWEDAWETVFEYFPRRPWNATRQGVITGSSIYDGSPGSAAQIASDGMQGYLCSPSFDWFKLSLEPEDLDDEPGVRLWLQACQEHLYYVLRTTNFYSTVNEYFYDALTVGTATMYDEEIFEEDGGGMINFSCRHPEEIYIGTDRYGRVDTVMRKWKMSYRNILSAFGSGLPADWKQKCTSSPDAEDELSHFVFPRTDADLAKMDSKNMPWASIYLLPSANRILRTSGYRKNPYQVWRWRVSSGETYGRSPAIDSIYDIKMLNKMGKTMLTRAQREATPPLNIPREMEGKVRMVPDGHNFYKEPQRIITEIGSRGSPQYGIEREARVTDIIERNFKVRYWLMLNDTKQRGLTATQVLQMAEEKAAVLGPNIGRLDAEFIQPMFERVFDIEMASGRLPQPPQRLMDMGARLNIQVLGPLAQAQKRLFKTQGILQSMEILEPMSKVFPGINDWIDEGIMARELLQEYGMPEKIIRSEKQVLAKRAAAQRMIQQAQMVQNLQGIAAAGKDMSAPAQPGSPLAEAMKTPGVAQLSTGIPAGGGA